MVRSRQIAAALALLLVMSACAGSSDQATPEQDRPETAEPADPLPTPVVSEPAADPEPSPTEPPAADPPVDGASTETGAFAIVSRLASDDLMGRDNQTESSLLAQAFLVEVLSEFAEPVGPDGYLVEYDRGTNVIGVIAGTDLADEFVMVGAHYDHLGTDCRGITSQDQICNGATDNATGVAAAMEVARALAASEPRRSVIVAFWDGEEDGLVGSREYVANPLRPLEQTVAYINFDIVGSNLLPSMSSSTVVIGAETGGRYLSEAAVKATADSQLYTAHLSLIFGQGRSDHASLAAAGVPVVFFTDATNGCYHTVSDDLDAVDFDKLDLQIANATALALDLVDTDTPPVFDPSAAITVPNDAVELLGLLSAGEPDLDLLGPQARPVAEEFLAALGDIVEAGPGGYRESAVNTVFVGTATLIETAANSGCR